MKKTTSKKTSLIKEAKKSKPPITKNESTQAKKTKEVAKSSPTSEPVPSLRVIPLGGLEEIGRNMTIFEYGEDIIIVDCGLMFPEEEMIGIDYIIPNIEYLQDKTNKIRGVIITHGHLDHIGAIPHILPKIGNPPVYATELTAQIIKRRQEDYKELAPLNLNTVRKIDKITLGNFQIEFFHVNHSIPDAVGLAIRTPVGLLIHTGDFKFDHSPVGDIPANISKIARLGSEEVLALLSDSTDSQKEGYSISESKIKENLNQIFLTARGRIIAATFSNLVSRIQEIVELADQHGRKLAVDGYSMKNIVEITRKLGYLNARSSTFIDIKEVNHYPDQQVVVLCTGAQGEGNAILMRIVNNEHRHVQIHKGDTVIFSSSVIPGNERSVQGIKDTLYKKGAEVIHSQMMDIHSGGHARSEDLKMMMSLLRPKYLIPIHGTFYMLKIHGRLAQSVGIGPERVMIGENGRVIEFNPRGEGRLTLEKITSSYVMVDGLGVGDVGSVVLRDRQLLAQDGMVTVVVVIDKKNLNIVGEPQINSRGFIYVKKNSQLLKDLKDKIQKIIDQATDQEARPNWNYLKNSLRDKLGQFLFKKTQRRPMIIPVIIEI